ncbi:MAG: acetyl-CoA carboxylase carboxyltransferase subunit alpha [Clostridiaceae bacterium]|nr:acetyl-CoA carboxylase carboxyltransferase subunit alpha [Clostridiaceae bacterium]
MKHEFDFEKQIVEMEKAVEKLRDLNGDKDKLITAQLLEQEQRLTEKKKEIYQNLTSWETLQVARHPNRPVLSDYIKFAFTDFIELHGDRCFSDDRALIGGFATLENKKVMLIGHNKGKNVEENIKCNFGMPHPDGYRKALRLMKLAEKFNLPIVTLIDTTGAFPGLAGEERCVAEAIARNLTEMAKIEVPIICVVTGEGGSGGALAIGVGDALLMLSHSIYSVITPEGCATILWRDASFASDAANAMKIKSNSHFELGVIDEVIEEPIGGAHTNPQKTAEVLKTAVLKYIKKFESWSPSKLINKRFEKYSSIGKFNR